MPPNNQVVCRLCLSADVRLFSIGGTSLLAVFEKLTNTKLYTADRRPSVVCFICLAHLRKCHKLMKMSAQAELVLTGILKKYDQVTNESVFLMDDQLKNLRGKLSFSKCDWIDTTLPPASVEVKIEPEVDDLFVTPASTGVEINIEQSDVRNDSRYNGVEVKVEDFVECSDVTIVEVKTEDELDIVEMENEWQGLPQASTNEESDVDIENVSIPGDRTLHEHEPNILQKKGVAANAKSNLKKKDRPEERLFECNICQHRFYQLIHLRTHKRIHTGEKPYQCNKCPIRFSDKSTLNSHLLIHTGEKPFECNICQQRYYKKSHLNRHLTTHSGNKPFECNVCHHKFFDKSGLECHLRIHSDEKPFECDMCHRRFNYKHVLMKHFRTHTGEKPYSCDICQRRFAKKFNSQIHLKKMHGVDTFKKKSI